MCAYAMGLFCYLAGNNSVLYYSKNFRNKNMNSKETVLCLHTDTGHSQSFHGEEILFSFLFFPAGSSLKFRAIQYMSVCFRVSLWHDDCNLFE